MGVCCGVVTVEERYNMNDEEFSFRTACGNTSKSVISPRTVAMVLRGDSCSDKQQESKDEAGIDQWRPIQILGSDVDLSGKGNKNTTDEVDTNNQGIIRGIFGSFHNSSKYNLFRKNDLDDEKSDYKINGGNNQRYYTQSDKNRKGGSPLKDNLQNRIHPIVIKMSEHCVGTLAGVEGMQSSFPAYLNNNNNINRDSSETNAPTGNNNNNINMSEYYTSSQSGSLCPYIWHISSSLVPHVAIPSHRVGRTWCRDPLRIPQVIEPRQPCELSLAVEVSHSLLIESIMKICLSQVTVAYSNCESHSVQSRDHCSNVDRPPGMKDFICALHRLHGNQSILGDDIFKHQGHRSSIQSEISLTGSSRRASVTYPNATSDSNSSFVHDRKHCTTSLTRTQRQRETCSTVLKGLHFAVNRIFSSNNASSSSCIYGGQFGGSLGILSVTSPNDTRHVAAASVSSLLPHTTDEETNNPSLSISEIFAMTHAIEASVHEVMAWISVATIMQRLGIDRIDVEKQVMVPVLLMLQALEMERTREREEAVGLAISRTTESPSKSDLPRAGNNTHRKTSRERSQSPHEKTWQSFNLISEDISKEIDTRQTLLDIACIPSLLSSSASDQQRHIEMIGQITAAGSILTKTIWSTYNEYYTYKDQSQDHSAPCCVSGLEEHGSIYKNNHSEIETPIQLLGLKEVAQVSVTLAMQCERRVLQPPLSNYTSLAGLRIINRCLADAWFLLGQALSKSPNPVAEVVIPSLHKFNYFVPTTSFSSSNKSTTRPTTSSTPVILLVNEVYCYRAALTAYPRHVGALSALGLLHVRAAHLLGRVEPNLQNVEKAVSNQYKDPEANTVMRLRKGDWTFSKVYLRLLHQKINSACNTQQSIGRRVSFIGSVHDNSSVYSFSRFMRSDKESAQNRDVVKNDKIESTIKNTHFGPRVAKLSLNNVESKTNDYDSEDNEYDSDEYEGEEDTVSCFDTCSEESFEDDPELSFYRLNHYRRKVMLGKFRRKNYKLSDSNKRTNKKASIDRDNASKKGKGFTSRFFSCFRRRFISPIGRGDLKGLTNNLTPAKIEARWKTNTNSHSLTPTSTSTALLYFFRDRSFRRVKNDRLSIERLVESLMVDDVTVSKTMSLLSNSATEDNKDKVPVVSCVISLQKGLAAPGPTVTSSNKEKAKKADKEKYLSIEEVSALKRKGIRLLLYSLYIERNQSQVWNALGGNSKLCGNISSILSAVYPPYVLQTESLSQPPSPEIKLQNISIPAEKEPFSSLISVIWSPAYVALCHKIFGSSWCLERWGLPSLTFKNTTAKGVTDTSFDFSLGKTGVNSPSESAMSAKSRPVSRNTITSNIHNLDDIEFPPLLACDEYYFTTTLVLKPNVVPRSKIRCYHDRPGTVRSSLNPIEKGVNPLDDINGPCPPTGDISPGNNSFKYRINNEITHSKSKSTMLSSTPTNKETSSVSDKQKTQSRRSSVQQRKVFPFRKSSQLLWENHPLMSTCSGIESVIDRVRAIANALEASYGSISLPFDNFYPHSDAVLTSSNINKAELNKVEDGELSTVSQQPFSFSVEDQVLRNMFRNPFGLIGIISSAIRGADIGGVGDSGDSSVAEVPSGDCSINMQQLLSLSIQGGSSYFLTCPQVLKTAKLINSTPQSITKSPAIGLSYLPFDSLHLEFAQWWNALGKEMINVYRETVDMFSKAIPPALVTTSEFFFSQQYQNLSNLQNGSDKHSPLQTTKKNHDAKLNTPSDGNVNHNKNYSMLLSTPISRSKNSSRLLFSLGQIFVEALEATNRASFFMDCGDSWTNEGDRGTEGRKVQGAMDEPQILDGHSALCALQKARFSLSAEVSSGFSWRTMGSKTCNHNCQRSIGAQMGSSSLWRLYMSYSFECDKINETLAGTSSKKHADHKSVSIPPCGFSFAERIGDNYRKLRLSQLKLVAKAEQRRNDLLCELSSSKGGCEQFNTSLFRSTSRRPSSFMVSELSSKDDLSSSTNTNDNNSSFLRGSLNEPSEYPSNVNKAKALFEKSQHGYFRTVANCEALSFETLLMMSTLHSESSSQEDISSAPIPIGLFSMFSSARDPVTTTVFARSLQEVIPNYANQGNILRGTKDRIHSHSPRIRRKLKNILHTSQQMEHSAEGAPISQDSGENNNNNNNNTIKSTRDSSPEHKRNNIIEVITKPISLKKITSNKISSVGYIVIPEDKKPFSDEITAVPKSNSVSPQDEIKKTVVGIGGIDCLMALFSLALWGNTAVELAANAGNQFPQHNSNTGNTGNGDMYQTNKVNSEGGNPLGVLCGSRGITSSNIATSLDVCMPDISHNLSSIRKHCLAWESKETNISFASLTDRTTHKNNEKRICNAVQDYVSLFYLLGLTSILTDDLYLVLMNWRIYCKSNVLKGSDLDMNSTMNGLTGSDTTINELHNTIIKKLQRSSRLTELGVSPGTAKMYLPLCLDTTDHASVSELSANTTFLTRLATFILPKAPVSNCTLALDASLTKLDSVSTLPPPEHLIYEDCSLLSQKALDYFSKLSLTAKTHRHREANLQYDCFIELRRELWSGLGRQHSRMLLQMPVLSSVDIHPRCTIPPCRLLITTKKLRVLTNNHIDVRRQKSNVLADHKGETDMSLDPVSQLLLDDNSLQFDDRYNPYVVVPTVTPPVPIFSLELDKKVPSERLQEQIVTHRGVRSPKDSNLTPKDDSAPVFEYTTVRRVYHNPPPDPQRHLLLPIPAHTSLLACFVRMLESNPQHSIIWRALGALLVRQQQGSDTMLELALKRGKLIEEEKKKLSAIRHKWRNDMKKQRRRYVTEVMKLQESNNKVLGGSYLPKTLPVSCEYIMSPHMSPHMKQYQYTKDNVKDSHIRSSTLESERATVIVHSMDEIDSSNKETNDRYLPLNESKELINNDMESSDQIRSTPESPYGVQEGSPIFSYSSDDSNSGSDTEDSKYDEELESVLMLFDHFEQDVVRSKTEAVLRHKSSYQMLSVGRLISSFYRNKDSICNTGRKRSSTCKPEDLPSDGLPRIPIFNRYVSAIDCFIAALSISSKDPYSWLALGSIITDPDDKIKSERFGIIRREDCLVSAICNGYLPSFESVSDPKSLFMQHAFTFVLPSNKTEKPNNDRQQSNYEPLTSSDNNIADRRQSDGLYTPHPAALNFIQHLKCSGQLQKILDYQSKQKKPHWTDFCGDTKDNDTGHSMKVTPPAEHSGETIFKEEAVSGILLLRRPLVWFNLAMIIRLRNLKRDIEIFDMQRKVYSGEKVKYYSSSVIMDSEISKKDSKLSKKSSNDIDNLLKSTTNTTNTANMIAASQHLGVYGMLLSKKCTDVVSEISALVEYINGVIELRVITEKSNSIHKYTTGDVGLQSGNKQHSFAADEEYVGITTGETSMILIDILCLFLIPSWPHLKDPSVSLPILPSQCPLPAADVRADKLLNSEERGDNIGMSAPDCDTSYFENCEFESISRSFENENLSDYEHGTHTIDNLDATTRSTDEQRTLWQLTLFDELLLKNADRDPVIASALATNDVYTKFRTVLCNKERIKSYTMAYLHQFFQNSWGGIYYGASVYPEIDTSIVDLGIPNEQEESTISKAFSVFFDVDLAFKRKLDELTSLEGDIKEDVSGVQNDEIVKELKQLTAIEKIIAHSIVAELTAGKSDKSFTAQSLSMVATPSFTDIISDYNKKQLSTVTRLAAQNAEVAVSHPLMGAAVRVAIEGITLGDALMKCYSIPDELLVMMSITRGENTPMSRLWDNFFTDGRLENDSTEFISKVKSNLTNYTRDIGEELTRAIVGTATIEVCRVCTENSEAVARHVSEISDSLSHLDDVHLGVVPSVRCEQSFPLIFARDNTNFQSLCDAQQDIPQLQQRKVVLPSVAYTDNWSVTVINSIIRRRSKYSYLGDWSFGKLSGSILKNNATVDVTATYKPITRASCEFPYLPFQISHDTHTISAMQCSKSTFCRSGSPATIAAEFPCNVSMKEKCANSSNQQHNFAVPPIIQPSILEDLITFAGDCEFLSGPQLTCPSTVTDCNFDIPLINAENDCYFVNKIAGASNSFMFSLANRLSVFIYNKKLICQKSTRNQLKDSINSTPADPLGIASGGVNAVDAWLCLGEALMRYPLRKQHLKDDAELARLKIVIEKQKKFFSAAFLLTSTSHATLSSFLTSELTSSVGESSGKNKKERPLSGLSMSKSPDESKSSDEFSGVSSFVSFNPRGFSEDIKVNKKRRETRKRVFETNVDVSNLIAASVSIRKEIKSSRGRKRMSVPFNFLEDNDDRIWEGEYSTIDDDYIDNNISGPSISSGDLSYASMKNLRDVSTSLPREYDYSRWKRRSKAPEKSLRKHHRGEMNSKRIIDTDRPSFLDAISECHTENVNYDDVKLMEAVMNEEMDESMDLEDAKEMDAPLIDSYRTSVNANNMKRPRKINAFSDSIAAAAEELRRRRTRKANDCKTDALNQKDGRPMADKMIPNFFSASPVALRDALANFEYLPLQAIFASVEILDEDNCSYYWKGGPGQDENQKKEAVNNSIIAKRRASKLARLTSKLQRANHKRYENVLMGSSMKGSLESSKCFDEYSDSSNESNSGWGSFAGSNKDFKSLESTMCESIHSYNRNPKKIDLCSSPKKRSQPQIAFERPLTRSVTVFTCLKNALTGMMELAVKSNVTTSTQRRDIENGQSSNIPSCGESSGNIGQKVSGVEKQNPRTIPSVLDPNRHLDKAALQLRIDRFDMLLESVNLLLSDFEKRNFGGGQVLCSTEANENKPEGEVARENTTCTAVAGCTRRVFTGLSVNNPINRDSVYFQNQLPTSGHEALCNVASIQRHLTSSFPTTSSALSLGQSLIQQIMSRFLKEADVGGGKYVEGYRLLNSESYDNSRNLTNAEREKLLVSGKHCESLSQLTSTTHATQGSLEDCADSSKTARTSNHLSEKEKYLQLIGLLLDPGSIPFDTTTSVKSRLLLDEENHIRESEQYESLHRLLIGTSSNVCSQSNNVSEIKRQRSIRKKENFSVVEELEYEEDIRPLAINRMIESRSDLDRFLIDALQIKIKFLRWVPDRSYCYFEKEEDINDGGTDTASLSNEKSDKSSGKHHKTPTSDQQSFISVADAEKKLSSNFMESSSIGSSEGAITAVEAANQINEQVSAILSSVNLFAKGSTKETEAMNSMFKCLISPDTLSTCIDSSVISTFISSRRRDELSRAYIELGCILLTPVSLDNPRPVIGNEALVNYVQGNIKSSKNTRGGVNNNNNKDNMKVPQKNTRGDNRNPIVTIKKKQHDEDISPRSDTSIERGSNEKQPELMIGLVPNPYSPYYFRRLLSPVINYFHNKRFVSYTYKRPCVKNGNNSGDNEVLPTNEADPKQTVSVLNISSEVVKNMGIVMLNIKACNRAGNSQSRFNVPFRTHRLCFPTVKHTVMMKDRYKQSNSQRASFSAVAENSTNYATLSSDQSQNLLLLQERQYRLERRKQRCIVRKSFRRQKALVTFFKSYMTRPLLIQPSGPMSLTSGEIEFHPIWGFIRNKWSEDRWTVNTSAQTSESQVHFKQGMDTPRYNGPPYPYLASGVFRSAMRTFHHVDPTTGGGFRRQAEGPPSNTEISNLPSQSLDLHPVSSYVAGAPPFATMLSPFLDNTTRHHNQFTFSPNPSISIRSQLVLSQERCFYNPYHVFFAPIVVHVGLRRRLTQGSGGTAAPAYASRDIPFHLQMPSSTVSARACRLSVEYSSPTANMSRSQEPQKRLDETATFVKRKPSSKHDTEILNTSKCHKNKSMHIEKDITIVDNVSLAKKAFVHALSVLDTGNPWAAVGLCICLWLEQRADSLRDTKLKEIRKQRDILQTLREPGSDSSIICDSVSLSTNEQFGNKIPSSPPFIHTKNQPEQSSKIGVYLPISIPGECPVEREIILEMMMLNKMLKDEDLAARDRYAKGNYIPQNIPSSRMGNVMRFIKAYVALCEYRGVDVCRIKSNLGSSGTVFNIEHKVQGGAAKSLVSTSNDNNLAKSDNSIFRHATVHSAVACAAEIQQDSWMDSANANSCNSIGHDFVNFNNSGTGNYQIYDASKTGIAPSPEIILRREFLLSDMDPIGIVAGMPYGGKHNDAHEIVGTTRRFTIQQHRESIKSEYSILRNSMRRNHSIGNSSEKLQEMSSETSLLGNKKTSIRKAKFSRSDSSDDDSACYDNNIPSTTHEGKVGYSNGLVSIERANTGSLIVEDVLDPPDIAFSNYIGMILGFHETEQFGIDKNDLSINNSRITGGESEKRNVMTEIITDEIEKLDIEEYILMKLCAVENNNCTSPERFSKSNFGAATLSNKEQSRESKGNSAEKPPEKSLPSQRPRFNLNVSENETKRTPPFDKLESALPDIPSLLLHNTSLIPTITLYAPQYYHLHLLRKLRVACRKLLSLYYGQLRRRDAHVDNLFTPGAPGQTHVKKIQRIDKNLARVVMELQRMHVAFGELKLCIYADVTKTDIKENNNTVSPGKRFDKRALVGEVRDADDVSVRLSVSPLNASVSAVKPSVCGCAHMTMPVIPSLTREVTLISLLLRNLFSLDKEIESNTSRCGSGDIGANTGVEVKSVIYEQHQSENKISHSLTENPLKSNKNKTGDILTSLDSGRSAIHQDKNIVTRTHSKCSIQSFKNVSYKQESFYEAIRASSVLNSISGSGFNDLLLSADTWFTNDPIGGVFSGIPDINLLFSDYFFGSGLLPQKAIPIEINTYNLPGLPTAFDMYGTKGLDSPTIVEGPESASLTVCNKAKIYLHAGDVLPVNEVVAATTINPLNTDDFAEIQKVMQNEPLSGVLSSVSSCDQAFLQGNNTSLENSRNSEDITTPLSINFKSPDRLRGSLVKSSLSAHATEINKKVKESLCCDSVRRRYEIKEASSNSWASFVKFEFALFEGLLRRIQDDVSCDSENAKTKQKVKLNNPIGVIPVSPAAFKLLKGGVVHGAENNNIPQHSNMSLNLPSAIERLVLFLDYICNLDYCPSKEAQGPPREVCRSEVSECSRIHYNTFFRDDESSDKSKTIKSQDSQTGNSNNSQSSSQHRIMQFLQTFNFPSSNGKSDIDHQNNTEGADPSFCGQMYTYLTRDVYSVGASTIDTAQQSLLRLLGGVIGVKSMTTSSLENGGVEYGSSADATVIKYHHRVLPFVAFFLSTVAALRLKYSEDIDTLSNGNSNTIHTTESHPANQKLIERTIRARLAELYHQEIEISHLIMSLIQNEVASVLFNKYLLMRLACNASIVVDSPGPTMNIISDKQSRFALINHSQITEFFNTNNIKIDPLQHLSVASSTNEACRSSTFPGTTGRCVLSRISSFGEAKEISRSVSGDQRKNTEVIQIHDADEVYRRLKEQWDCYCEHYWSPLTRGSADTLCPIVSHPSNNNVNDNAKVSLNTLPDTIVCDTGVTAKQAEESYEDTISQSHNYTLSTSNVSGPQAMGQVLNVIKSTVLEFMGCGVSTPHFSAFLLNDTEEEAGIRTMGAKLPPSTRSNNRFCDNFFEMVMSLLMSTQYVSIHGSRPFLDDCASDEDNNVMENNKIERRSSSTIESNNVPPSVKVSPRLTQHPCLLGLDNQYQIHSDSTSCDEGLSRKTSNAVTSQKTLKKIYNKIPQKEHLRRLFLPNYEFTPVLPFEARVSPLEMYLVHMMRKIGLLPTVDNGVNGPCTRGSTCADRLFMAVIVAKTTISRGLVLKNNPIGMEMMSGASMVIKTRSNNKMAFKSQSNSNNNANKMAGTSPTTSSTSVEISQPLHPFLAVTPHRWRSADTKFFACIFWLIVSQSLPKKEHLTVLAKYNAGVLSSNSKEKESGKYIDQPISTSTKQYAVASNAISASQHLMDFRVTALRKSTAVAHDMLGIPAYNRTLPSYQTGDPQGSAAPVIGLLPTELSPAASVDLSSPALLPYYEVVARDVLRRAHAEDKNR